MENKLFYPAIFTKAEEGGYTIRFPDFPEAITEGDEMNEAYEMAIDCLYLALSVRQAEKQTLPSPSSVENIKLDQDSFLVIVEFDLAAYRRKVNSKAVKKTLSIPGWLNEEASAKGINFSQVLQEALINKLQTMER